VEQLWRWFLGGTSTRTLHILPCHPISPDVLLSNGQTLKPFNFFPLVRHWTQYACRISKCISLNTSQTPKLFSQVNRDHCSTILAFITPDPTNVSESRILSIRVLSPTDQNCTSPYPDSFIPSNVNFYPTLTTNSTRYSCFAFANVTYTAGGADCQNCKIVSPAVVEGNIDGKNLQPVPDPLTVEALAITPSVGTHTLLTVFADVTTDVSTPLNSLAIEFVSRAYQSAWSSLVLTLGYIGPNNQTSVSFALPASHPTVTRWRVYVWAGLQLGLLLCGITFAYWQSHFRHPWFSDPTMIAFQLDTARIFQQGAVANPKDPWDPDAEPPAGRLQLEDYDHQRPGQPRAVTLIQRNVKYTELTDMEMKPFTP